MEDFKKMYIQFLIEIFEEIRDEELTPINEILILEEDCIVVDWYYPKKDMFELFEEEFGDTNKEKLQKREDKKQFLKDLPKMKNILVGTFIEYLIEKIGKEDFIKFVNSKEGEDYISLIEDFEK